MSFMYFLFRETNESGLDTFDDTDVTKHMSLFEVGDLYLMMGRELENLEEVPAGNIVGMSYHYVPIIIGGEESLIFVCVILQHPFIKYSFLSFMIGFIVA